MNIYRTFQILFVSAALLGFSAVSHAIPTLEFAGTITFNSTSGELKLNAELTGSQSIIPAPDLGGSITLSTFLVTPSDLGSVYIGNFGGGSVTVDDINPDVLLAGGFTEATLVGKTGSNGGALELVFSPTGGTLLNYFSDPSDLLALTLNLSADFGPMMFKTDFSGEVTNGFITSRKEVNEPAVLSMLLIGIGLIGASGLHRYRKCWLTNV